MVIKSNKRYPLLLQVAALLGLIFLFMSSVNMMGAGFKLLGKGFGETLLNVTSNPFAGLMIGVITTAVVQSSSATTSLVVSLVAAGTVSIENAVPVVMGANIGTTITCSLVAMGYVGRRGRFRRAFAAGTMHDFFNIITVIILLPVELVTGFLSRTAIWTADRLSAVTGLSSPKSPIKAATGSSRMAPRKTKSSLQKPIRPGRPRDAKAVTNVMP